MARKLDLEPPYSKDWRNAYLVYDVDGRKKVILYNSEKERTSTLYSRYLMATKLGRYLKITEHVDHINEDRLDDRIENLQILTREANQRKNNFSRGRKMVRLKCPNCGKVFTREKRQTFSTLGKSKKAFCSRSCSSTFSHRAPANWSSPQEYEEFREFTTFAQ